MGGIDMIMLSELNQYKYQLDRNSQVILKFVNKLVKEEDIKFFYPKYMLSDTDKGNQEAIILTNSNKIWVFKIVDGKCKVEILDANDIGKVVYENNLETRNVTLEIEFKSGDRIKMDSEKDANRNWERKYIDKIEEITTMLST